MPFVAFYFWCLLYLFADRNHRRFSRLSLHFCQAKASFFCWCSSESERNHMRPIENISEYSIDSSATKRTKINIINVIIPARTTARQRWRKSKCDEQTTNVVVIPRLKVFFRRHRHHHKRYFILRFDFVCVSRLVRFYLCYSFHCFVSVFHAFTHYLLIHLSFAREFIEFYFSSFFLFHFFLLSEIENQRLVLNSEEK